MAALSSPPLRRNGPFVRYWAASAISGAGSQVTMLALPLTGIAVLHARTGQVALLATAATLPNLLGVGVGARVERFRRRRLLLAADLGRAVVLASVPVAYGLGVLVLWQLYAVAVAGGTLGLLFEVASQAYLPALVERRRLVEANAAFEAARAGAQTGGPAAAGLLLGVVAAPLAILADAASFLASAVLLLTVRIAEQPPQRRPTAVRGAARAVLRHPSLGPLLAAHALANLAIGSVWAVLLVFAVRTLGLGPGEIGGALAFGQLGAFAGAGLGRRLAARIGVGRALALSFALFGPAALLLAASPRRGAVAVFGAAWTLEGVARALYDTFAAAVRQAAVPLEEQARVTGVTTTVGVGAFPLGTLLGGVLATAIGPRGAMLAGAAVSFLPCLPVLLSPLLRLQRVDGDSQPLATSRASESVSAPSGAIRCRSRARGGRR